MKRHVTAAIDDAMGRALCRETRSAIKRSSAPALAAMFLDDLSSLAKACSEDEARVAAERIAGTAAAIVDVLFEEA